MSMETKHMGCRHWVSSRDFCVKLHVMAPRTKCVGCEFYEGGDPGLGDAVEKLIDIGTLGQGKKIAKVVAKATGKKDCGCGKRRAALNRLGDKLSPKKGGD